MVSWLVTEIRSILSMHIFFLALLYIYICLHMLFSSTRSQFYVGSVSDFFKTLLILGNVHFLCYRALLRSHDERQLWEILKERRKNNYFLAATASILMDINGQQRQELWKCTLLASVYPASFINAGGRHETPGSEKKNFINHGIADSTSFMFTTAPLE